MRRTNIYLSDRQMGDLRAASESSGLSVAELVRRAVDEWLGRAKGEGGKRDWAEVKQESSKG